MTVKPSRFVGILVTAAVLGAAIFYYRDADPSRGGASASDVRRGGQILPQEVHSRYDTVRWSLR